MRTPVRLVAMAGVLALGVVGGVGCRSSSTPAATTGDGAPTSSPSVPSGPATPSSSASPSVPAGRLLWTVQAGSHARAAVVPDGYVLAVEREVLGLDRDGRQRWHQTYDEDVQVSVAGSTVIVWRRNPARQEWPGSLIIQAFDPTSGTTLWTDDRPSFVTVLATAVYTSVCHGGQRNHLGDCWLSARDPATGRIAWTIATYASSSVATEVAHSLPTDVTAPPVPAYLAVRSYPTGYSSSTYTSVDAHSGRPLGASVRSPRVEPASTALLQVSDEPDSAKGHCTTTVTAWSPRGAGVIWRKTFTSAADAKGGCLGVDSTLDDRVLALSDRSGPTTLVDLATGRVDWTASEPGAPLWVDHQRLITTNADGGVTSYDLASRSARWRTGRPGGAGGGDAQAAVRPFGRWVLVFDPAASQTCGPGCPTVGVLDLTSGGPYRASPGTLVTAGRGTIVTETRSEGQAVGTSTYRAYSIP